MNMAQFRWCMEQLAWSSPGLADEMNCAAITVRHWVIGHVTAPAQVAT
jgi:hypothetical protein